MPAGSRKTRSTCREPAAYPGRRFRKRIREDGSGHRRRPPIPPDGGGSRLPGRAELGETAVGSDHYRALFTLGILLFIVTFVINLTADIIVRGRREG